MTDDHEVASGINRLPAYTVGVEHEYKWLLDQTPGNVPEALGSMGLSAGYPVRTANDVTHSSVYFDDPGWSLARAGLSLTLRVYHGTMRAFGALVAKHTLEWRDGRRDAAELAVRVDPRRAEESLQDWELLPLRHLARYFHQRLPLSPYATAVQVRKQARLGTALALSLDRTSISRPADPKPLDERTWLEIECNEPGRGTLRELGDLAGKITAAVGRAPHELTKPEMAARLMGWDGTR
ncbi:hypothetical protein [Streptosporangium sandarakinum]|uniref:hypothetical protein n=1 Tax=Streptosporangium sandarakinum TaxID=1260955 RepID=UPI0037ADCAD9